MAFSTEPQEARNRVLTPIGVNAKWRKHAASWGVRKVRERLIRRFSGIKIPAKRTVHAVLDRHGLAGPRGRLPVVVLSEQLYP